MLSMPTTSHADASFNGLPRAAATRQVLYISPSATGHYADLPPAPCYADAAADCRAYLPSRLSSTAHAKEA